MKRIVILTGAGISAESGLKTFRGAGGLWEGYNVYDVATPEAWAKDPALVLRFYNERRHQAMKAQPNQGHKNLVRLEEKYHVDIITQNVDDLHERAGSTNILHLHGMLNKARSVYNEELTYDIEKDLEIGDMAPPPNVGQLRPHIVWFGEPVPLIPKAAAIVAQADIMLIVGTSLVVYPAAGLVDFLPIDSPVYVIDPGEPMVTTGHKVTFVAEPGTVGVPKVVDELMVND